VADRRIFWVLPMFAPADLGLSKKMNLPENRPGQAFNKNFLIKFGSMRDGIIPPP